MNTRYIAIVLQGWGKASSKAGALKVAKEEGNYKHKQHIVYRYCTPCGRRDFEDSVYVNDVNGNVRYDPEAVSGWELVEKVGF